jgi:hypothetical protein
MSLGQPTENPKNFIQFDELKDLIIDTQGYRNMTSCWIVLYIGEPTLPACLRGGTTSPLVPQFQTLRGTRSRKVGVKKDSPA